MSVCLILILAKRNYFYLDLTIVLEFEFRKDKNLFTQPLLFTAETAEALLSSHYRGFKRLIFDILHEL